MCIQNYLKIGENILSMRILVAGGAGFIGSHLTDALLKNMHEVICIDNLSLGTKDNIAHLIGNDRFQFYETDLLNMEKVDEIIRKERIEYVFHLAANSDIQASAGSPQIEYHNTYSTTYSLLEAMRKNKVKKIFFASTSAVYGDKKNQLLDENTPDLRPISYYGAAKLGSEALISAYSYMNDISALIFRFPNVIGPRLTHGVIYDFIRKLKNNSAQLEILGNGRQTKPYIYIFDLIDAIIQFMDRNKDRVNIYNIGVDTATSVTKIADIICEEMNLKNVIYKYTGDNSGWKGDVPRFQYCLDKVHNAGWHANYTSDEAVRMAVQNNIS